MENTPNEVLPLDTNFEKEKEKETQPLTIQHVADQPVKIDSTGPMDSINSDHIFGSIEYQEMQYQEIPMDDSMDTTSLFHDTEGTIERFEVIDALTGIVEREIMHKKRKQIIKVEKETKYRKTEKEKEKKEKEKEKKEKGKKEKKEKIPKQSIQKRKTFEYNLALSAAKRQTNTIENAKNLFNFVGLCIYHIKNPHLVARLVSAHSTHTNHVPTNRLSIRWEFPIGTGIIYSNIWTLSIQAQIYLWRIDPSHTLSKIANLNIEDCYPLWEYEIDNEKKLLSSFISPQVLQGNKLIEENKIPILPSTFPINSLQRINLGTFKFTPTLNLINGTFESCDNILIQFYEKYQQWLNEEPCLNFRVLSPEEEAVMKEFIQRYSYPRLENFSTYDEFGKKIGTNYDSDYPNLGTLFQQNQKEQGFQQSRLPIMWDLLKKSIHKPGTNHPRKKSMEFTTKEPEKKKTTEPIIEQNPIPSQIINPLRNFDCNPRKPEYYIATGCLLCDEDILIPRHYDCSSQIYMGHCKITIQPDTGFKCYSDPGHTFCPLHFKKAILDQLAGMQFPLQCPFSSTETGQRCDFAISIYYIEAYLKEVCLTQEAKDFWINRLQQSHEFYKIILCKNTTHHDLVIHQCIKPIFFEDKSMICGAFFEITPVKSGTLSTLYECKGKCGHRYCIVCEQIVEDPMAHANCKRWFNYTIDRKGSNSLIESIEKFIDNGKQLKEKTAELERVLILFKARYISLHFINSTTQVCPCCYRRYSIYSGELVDDCYIGESPINQKEPKPISQFKIQCICGINWCIICYRILPISETQFQRLKSFMNTIRIFNSEGYFAPPEEHYGSIDEDFNLPGAISFTRCPINTNQLIDSACYSHLPSIPSYTFEQQFWFEYFIALRSKICIKLDFADFKSAFPYLPIWIKNQLKKTINYGI